MSAFRKFDLNLIPASAPREGAAKVAKTANPGRTLATLATLAGGDRLSVAPDLADLDSIRAWLVRRATAREASGTPKVDAERLVFDQLLWLWYAANPTTPPRDQCAACGTAFGVPVLALPDGAKVCDVPDYACLITYGNGRRMEAVGALKSLGLEPPQWWEL